MNLTRLSRWIASCILAAMGLVVLAALLLVIQGGNWLRGPVEHLVEEKTGRALRINGDLTLEFAWPLPRIHAHGVNFANPAWATEKQMVAADAVTISIDIPQLLRRRIVFPEVRLERPVIFLEHGNAGQKNWLLDLKQQDEGAHIRIERLTLDHGTLGYDDAARRTRLHTEISTASGPADSAELSFSAQGQYQGLPFTAQGKGGPVLALRDETTPYPLQANLRIGHTDINVNGTITSLLQLSAVDMHLAIQGKSMAQLFPLIGIVFPETRPYKTDGRLLHSGKTWHYQHFSGSMGNSDLAGSLQISTGGKRPELKAELLSRRLDLTDLGPLIGATPGRLDAAKKAVPDSATTVATPTRLRVLPDLPFTVERWDSVDAEVGLKAQSIHGIGALPIENLATHLSLRNSVLRLDPLDFGVADGHLMAAISLDGRKKPIQATARLRARKISLSKLLPASELGKSGLGQIGGEFDLAGHGNSVGLMLGSSSGKLGLIISGGRISRLMMEKAGLHVWEILALNITGDKLIKLRCGIADFSVRDGNMNANALIFDTEITTIIGTGNVDLKQERLDLTLNQKTKSTSPLALRSPIRIHGSFAQPVAEVDKGRIVVRALGALTLGLVNPVLAMLPLIDPGPGEDRDCGPMVRAVKAAATSAKNKGASVAPR